MIDIYSLELVLVGGGWAMKCILIHKLSVEIHVLTIPCNHLN